MSALIDAADVIRERGEAVAEGGERFNTSYLYVGLAFTSHEAKDFVRQMRRRMAQMLDSGSNPTQVLEAIMELCLTTGAMAEIKERERDA